MPDIIRVYDKSGQHHDYLGADFFTDPDVLTVTRPPSDDDPVPRIVAVWAKGHYTHAERLPEGTPPPDNTPLFA